MNNILFKPIYRNLNIFLIWLAGCLVIYVSTFTVLCVVEVNIVVGAEPCKFVLLFAFYHCFWCTQSEADLTYHNGP